MRHNTPHPRDLKARAEKLFGKGGKTSDGPLVTAGELMVSLHLLGLILVNNHCYYFYLLALYLLPLIFSFVIISVLEQEFAA